MNSSLKDRRQAIVDEWLTQFDRTSEITDADINELLVKLWPGRVKTTGRFETRERLEDFALEMYSGGLKTSIKKIADVCEVSPECIRQIVKSKKAFDSTDTEKREKT